MEYRDISAHIEKTDFFIQSQITNRFINEILAQKYRHIDIKADIKKKCMSRQLKEYIHSIGEWENYLRYLKDEINKFYIKKENNNA